MKKKQKIFNMKIADHVRDEFRLACEIRGSTMSNELHRHIFTIIREEKARLPADDWATLLAESIARAANQPERLADGRALPTLPMEITPVEGNGEDKTG